MKRSHKERYKIEIELSHSTFTTWRADKETSVTALFSYSSPWMHLTWAVCGEQRKVTMVMWQILIGRVLKAWNNQVLRPARGSAVHVLLLKEGREKKNYIKKKKKGDIPCSKNHAVFQIQERLLFFHRVQRVGQGEGGSCLFFRGTSCLNFRELWHFDPVNLRPPALSSLSISILSISPSLSDTHTRFQLPLVDLTSGADTKKLNKKTKKTDQSFLQGKRTGSGTLIQSHTSGDARTHCQVPQTLSNLMQPWGKKAAEENDRGKKPNTFSIFPFPGKQRTRKHCFQELLVARGPVVHVCTYTHTHTLPAPLGASKTPMNAQSKIYSSEKQQPKAFQGRQLGCRACGLTKKACRLQLELTS